jgi:hypothetical protein
MKRATFSWCSACVLFAACVFVLVRRDNSTRLGFDQQTPTSSETLSTLQSNNLLESRAWERVATFQSSNAALRKLSISNEPFQQWGRQYMLKVANEHLSKAPLYGLEKTPLKESDVIVKSFLSLNGAEFELTTKDLAHSMYYENGVLCKAQAVKAEMTGMFRDPSKVGRLEENTGVWSEDEAKRAAEQLVRAKGMNLRDLGATRGPVARAETFKFPTPTGSTKTITPFYTVTWYGRDDMCILEVRFRRTAVGSWETTYWFDNSRKTIDTESTSSTHLYKRFFDNEP